MKSRPVGVNEVDAVTGADPGPGQAAARCGYQRVKFGIGPGAILAVLRQPGQERPVAAPVGSCPPHLGKRLGP